MTSQIPMFFPFLKEYMIMMNFYVYYVVDLLWDMKVVGIVTPHYSVVCNF
jgi:hypothetical protein